MNDDDAINGRANPSQNKFFRKKNVYQISTIWLFALKFSQ